MTAEELEELNLVAFRYAAGEMPPEEAQAFETRLADDQAAQEALCRAVALGQRLAEAGPPVSQPADPVVPRKSAAWILQPLGWMAVGAAAALVIAAVLPLPSNSPRRGVRSGPVTQPDGPRTEPAVDALVWASLQASEDQTTVELERWLDETSEVAADEDDGMAAAEEVPSWVFAVKPHPDKRGNP